MHEQVGYPPPTGRGRVVVVISGAGGELPVRSLATRVAALGYDAVLVDGRDMMDNNGAELHDAILSALKSDHAVQGKVGVVGLSLGGQAALDFATRWPDLVATVIAWYPATNDIHEMNAFVSHFRVPVLAFAGEADSYRCCAVAAARAMAKVAATQGRPLQLITYPDANHDFAVPGKLYNKAAAIDSWRRASHQLSQALSN